MTQIIKVVNVRGPYVIQVTTDSGLSMSLDPGAETPEFAIWQGNNVFIHELGEAKPSNPE